MAVSGHYGNNETLIGMSASIGLTFYDENMNETQATTSRKSAGKRSKKSEYVLTKPIIEKYIFNSIF